MWFFDRIGTHYFSNYNNEAKAPMTGALRLQLVFRGASLDADAGGCPGFVPSLPGNWTKPCTSEELLLGNTCPRQKLASGLGWGHLLRAAPHPSFREVFATLPLQALQRGRHPCPRPSLGLRLSAPACVREQAGAPAVSSGLGSEVCVRLKAYLPVVNGQI